MSIFKGGATLLIIILLALTVSGCQQRPELSQLAMVVGVGLDRGEQQPLRLTVELAHQQRSDEPATSLVVSVEGENWATAEAALQNSLDKRPLWCNAVALVLGQGLTTEERDALLSAIYQDQRFSPGLLVLEAESAQDILKGSFGESDHLAQGVAETVTYLAKSSGCRPITSAAYVEQRLSGAPPPALPGLSVEEEAVSLGGTAIERAESDDEK